MPEPSDGPETAVPETAVPETGVPETGAPDTAAQEAGGGGDSERAGTETMMFMALPDPDAGRRRLWRAVRHPARSQIAVGVLLAALGFAAVIQVRGAADSSSYEGLRDSELIEVLDGLTGTAERARDEIERLEAARERLLSESSARGAALSEAQQREQTLNIMAGLVAVTGPGVRITITPGLSPVSLGALLDTVQELRTAGAEAIEFNDTVRVVAQSSFEATELGMQLDGVLLRDPYVIEVIGDPHVLRTALNFSDGPVDVLEDIDGAEVEIEEVSAVQIESVRDPVRMPHATTDTEG